jgi:hypothetical protein
MPWAKFREGEPVPVYFVLRNNRKSLLGLHSRLELAGPDAHVFGEDCSFSVRDLATGEEQVLSLSHITNCGGGSLVDVPANGYYVATCDLRRFCLAKRLQPGEYEVDWEFGALRAEAVRFTVAKSDAPKHAVRMRPALHFYQLTPKDKQTDGPEAAGETFIWRDCKLTHTHVEGMSAALAVGQTGVYVPDVQTIPASDGIVEASAVWKQYRDGDRIAVTLRAAAPHKEVRFNELPQLHLQIAAHHDYHPKVGLDERDEKLADRTNAAFVTPLTIEAKLPENWRERVSVSGACPVAVVVTSKRLTIPRGGLKQDVQNCQVDKHADSAESRPVWSGVVRTNALEVHFPPFPPALHAQGFDGD